MYIATVTSPVAIAISGHFIFLKDVYKTWIFLKPKKSTPDDHLRECRFKLFHSPSFIYSLWFLPIEGHTVYSSSACIHTLGSLMF